MNKMLSKINLQYISEYRTEIMGYAIIGVMLSHLKTTCDYQLNLLISKLIGLFCYSVFTGGFFFLSGLGLYNSFDRNYNLHNFYLKRFKRLVVPYWLISTPYFLYTDILLNNSYINFFEHFTTISFWLHVDDSGMWYVAVAVVFYIFYPVIHRILYCTKYKPIIVFIICVTLIFACSLLCKHVTPLYYSNIKIVFGDAILFLMGSYTMNKVKKEGGIKVTELILLLTFLGEVVREL